jgi:hypothetical protein
MVPCVEIFGMFGLRDVDRVLEESMSHIIILLYLAHHHQMLWKMPHEYIKGN